MPDPVTMRAHAKLTLSLRVTGVRPDGYHLIDAVMASLELHDLLTFHDLGPAREDPSDAPVVDAFRLDAVGPFAHGMPLGPTNLVVRALQLGDADSSRRPARVTIDKRIPHGGGLGGGSTNAATALRWAGFGTRPGDLERAATLGADIPFCLVGGRARVTGIGELVAPVVHLDRPITLIIPPVHVSTPAVYRAWDELDPKVRTGGRNDLEAAALVVEPQLARWRDEILRHIGVAPTLAGSGATWFLEGDLASDLTDLAARGATIVQTHTVDAVRATGPGA
jgi:4-diphosphocytidyl-2-C-methyl-D-erythritol kinase